MAPSLRTFVWSSGRPPVGGPRTGNPGGGRVCIGAGPAEDAATLEEAGAAAGGVAGAGAGAAVATGTDVAVRDIFAGLPEEDAAAASAAVDAAAAAAGAEVDAAVGVAVGIDGLAAAAGPTTWTGACVDVVPDAPKLCRTKFGGTTGMPAAAGAGRRLGLPRGAPICGSFGVPLSLTIWLAS